jgi:hypothetical protein
LYVALLYIVLQMFDAYVLTPLVDRRSVELPPVLTISAQVFLGLVFGFIGLLIASTLTAAAADQDALHRGCARRPLLCARASPMSMRLKRIASSHQ